MANNIPPEVLQRRLIYFRIPNEIWTDIHKLLSRRILLLQVAPASFRFKEICDKNVKNVHVIKKFYQFNNNLEKNAPDAIKQLEHLAANKCKLAGQFRLKNKSYFHFYFDNSKELLHHSLDLFHGCQVIWRAYNQWTDEKIAFLEEYLTILESAKPITIRMDLVNLKSFPDKFWHLPTVWNCTRLHVWSSRIGEKDSPLVTNIFEWLHHRSMDASDLKEFRCLFLVHFGIKLTIDLLINRCIQNFDQSQSETDRRQYEFVFYFNYGHKIGLDQFFRKENQKTGELLTFERLFEENDRPTGNYRLRRCLTHRECANARMLKGYNVRDEFINIGEERPKLVIS